MKNIKQGKQNNSTVQFNVFELSNKSAYKPHNTHHNSNQSNLLNNWHNEHIQQCYLLCNFSPEVIFYFRVHLKVLLKNHLLFYHVKIFASHIHDHSHLIASINYDHYIILKCSQQASSHPRE